MIEFRLPIRKPQSSLFLSTIEECRDWLRIFGLEDNKKSILDNSHRISDLTVAQSSIFQAHINLILEEIQSGAYSSSEVRLEHVAKAVLHLLSHNAPKLPIL